MRCGALLKKRRKLHSPLLPGKRSWRCLYLHRLQEKNAVLYLLCRRKVEWPNLQFILRITCKKIALSYKKAQDYYLFGWQQAEFYRHSKPFSAMRGKPCHKKESKNWSENCWCGKQGYKRKSEKSWYWDYTGWWLLLKTKRKDFLLYKKSKKFC